MKNFGRVLTAMVTPFRREDLSVDYDQAARLAERLVESGSDGVVVCGTTGESPTLTHEEKKRLFEVVADAIGGKASVIAGTGSYNTKESIELTKSAEKLGVDGIMLVVPYYNKPPQEALYNHFKAIAEQTSLPVMLYNVPGRTSQNLLPQTVAKLAEIKNIAAIKEASKDMEQVAELRRLTPPEFLIYSGDDATTLPMLSLGAVGVVSVASHLVGRRIKEMVEVFVSGRVETATAIHLELLPIFKAMFITTNPIPVKAAINLTGFDVGPLRAPLCECGEKELGALKSVLSNYGITVVS